MSTMTHTSDDPVIRVADLSHSFGHLEVFSNLSFEVPRGSICGLLGRNGSGKTTLLRLMLGVLWRSQGTVEVLGRDPQTDALTIRRRTGYVPQESDLDPTMTVRQTLDFLRPFFEPRWNEALVEEHLVRFQLQHCQETAVGTLSGGLRQRLSLVAALAIEPELLILDEPTAGLDAVVRRDFAEMVVEAMTEPRRTVLLSSHLLGELERLIDHVVILCGYGVIAMPLEELKTRLVRWIVRFRGTPPAAGPNHPSVVSRRQVRDTLRLSFWNDGDSEAKLRKWLEAADAHDIETDEASLESIFVDLVGESEPAAATLPPAIGGEHGR